MFILILICILCLLFLIMGQILKGIIPTWGIDIINTKKVKYDSSQRKITLFRIKSWYISILFGVRK